MVSMLVSSASAIRPSLQASPTCKASTFGRMRAFSTWRAGLLPFWISALSRSGSSALRLTLYFFTAFHFDVITNLRRAGEIDSEIGCAINDTEH
jgi:hypothetical protein